MQITFNIDVAEALYPFRRINFYAEFVTVENQFGIKIDDSHALIFEPGSARELCHLRIIEPDSYCHQAAALFSIP